MFCAKLECREQAQYIYFGFSVCPIHKPNLYYPLWTQEVFIQYIQGKNDITH